MARPGIIPESLHQELTALYAVHDPVLGRRRTFRDLSDWLRDAHGVIASREAVRNVVQALRAEAAEIRRDVLRERITAKVADQVDSLDDLMERARRIARRKNAKPAQVLAVLDEYRKGLETKLRFGGLGDAAKTDLETGVTPTDDNTRDARTELAAALAREATGDARRGPSGPAGEPDAGGR